MKKRAWLALSPFLFRLCRVLRAADAAESLARVSLAACEHRALHGDWPVSSAELAPLFPGAPPLDPYTEQPFMMERAGATLVIRAQPPEGAFVLDDASPRSEALEWRLPER